MDKEVCKTWNMGDGIVKGVYKRESFCKLLYQTKICCHCLLMYSLDSLKPKGEKESSNSNDRDSNEVVFHYLIIVPLGIHELMDTNVTNE